jgi:hypothetical protein
MNYPESAVGVAQRLQNSPNPAQAQLDGLVFVAEGVQELNRIGVGGAQA